MRTLAAQHDKSLHTPSLLNSTLGILRCRLRESNHVFPHVEGGWNRQHGIATCKVQSGSIQDVSLDSLKVGPRCELGGRLQGVPVEGLDGDAAGGGLG